MRLSGSYGRSSTLSGAAWGTTEAQLIIFQSGSRRNKFGTTARGPRDVVEGALDYVGTVRLACVFTPLQSQGCRSARCRCPFVSRVSNRLHLIRTSGETCATEAPHTERAPRYRAAQLATLTKATSTTKSSFSHCILCQSPFFI